MLKGNRKTKLQRIKEIKQTQENNLKNTQQDEYMLGCFNGIEVCLAILEDREPEFKTITKEPEVIEGKEHIGRTVASGIRKRNK